MLYLYNLYIYIIYESLFLFIILFDIILFCPSTEFTTLTNIRGTKYLCIYSCTCLCVPHKLSCDQ